MTELEPATPTSIVLRPHDPEPVTYTDADYSISAETAARLLNRHTENTKRAYGRNWDQFAIWCRSEGRVDLPATAQTLADYVVRLIGISLSPATIEQVIGTIHSVHSDAGHKGEPDSKHSWEVLRAYKREWADAGGRVRKATPVLLDALRAMVDTCDPGTRPASGTDPCSCSASTACAADPNCPAWTSPTSRKQATRASTSSSPGPRPTRTPAAQR